MRARIRREPANLEEARCEHPVKAYALFLGSTVGLVLVVSLLLGLVYPTPADMHAIQVSAIVAVVVQTFAFAIVRLTMRQNVIAGWGMGALLRFLVFAVYALLVVKALGLESSPALISLAAFFFVSTLVEPLLLNQ